MHLNVAAPFGDQRTPILSRKSLETSTIFASIKTWADLKGGTVGVSTFGSLTDQLTRYVLRRHGLKPETDVQIMQAGPSATSIQLLRSRSLR